MDHITEINLESRMKEITSLINIWTPRNLTLFGKITIIKSLLISKVTHILLSLPNPKTQTLYEIDCLFKTFLWKNKRPKYRSEILEHNQLDGGLGYPNLADFYDALKTSWIKGIDIGTGVWKDFLLALQKFHQKCSPASFEEFRLAPLWYNNMGNLILRNNWVEKGIMQVKDVLDSEGEIVERTHLNDMYNIQCNFLEYEQLAFSITNKLNEFSHNRNQTIGPGLPLLLSMVQCSNKGCSNIRKRMKGRNANLLQNIQEHWSTNLNEDIEFHYVKNTFLMSYIVTLDTFSRLIHFKLVHNRVMTYKLLFKMNLTDSFTCCFFATEKKLLFTPFLSAKMLLNSGGALKVGLEE